MGNLWAVAREAVQPDVRNLQGEAEEISSQYGRETTMILVRLHMLLREYGVQKKPNALSAYIPLEGCIRGMRVGKHTCLQSSRSSFSNCRQPADIPKRRRVDVCLRVHAHAAPCPRGIHMQSRRHASCHSAVVMPASYAHASLNAIRSVGQGTGLSDACN